MLNGSLTVKNDILLGSKIAMDRIMLLVCSNMDGSDKLPLLAIGKSARPWCRRGVNISKMNMEYTFSSKP